MVDAHKILKKFDPNFHEGCQVFRVLVTRIKRIVWMIAIKLVMRYSENVMVKENKRERKQY